MFKVIRKEDGRAFVVYSVRNDKVGYPHFLMWEDNQWKWQSAKYFSSLEEVY